MKEKSKGVFLFLFLLAALVVYSLYRGRAYDQLTETLADETAIGQGRPVLLELGASWCTYCRKMMPILGELSQNYSDQLTVAAVDVEENPDVARKYNVGPIPLLLFFDARGSELYRHTGFMPKEQIVEKWKQLGVSLK